MEAIQIHKHGFVRLDSAMADDLSVVNSARVSFGVSKSELEERDIGLIKYLMKHKHGTPFEHNSFRFHVRCPIALAREWFRHRIGGFNEESSRYSQLKPDFYIPAVEDVRTQVGKPGAYRFEQGTREQAELAIRSMSEAYDIAYEAYEAMLAAGVAREVARNVLPVGIYTSFYWSVNARSLMNFLSLRNAPQALKEIRDYAIAVEGIFAKQMPVTYEAWVENDRRAP